MNLHEYIDIFGREELAEVFQDKAFEFSEPVLPRFTELQRWYLRKRLGPDADKVIENGEKDKRAIYKAKCAYYCELYLKVTDRPIVFKNSLTEQQIQQAREYPTHELYEGKLIHSGRTYKASCPFHAERTPSFYFYDDGHYHCFGCQAHGNNAVDYLMATEKLSFVESVRRLV